MRSSTPDRSLSSLITHLSTLDDPRVTGRCAHPFLTVLVVTVLGVLGGANGWEEIEDFVSVVTLVDGDSIKLFDGLAASA